MKSFDIYLQRCKVREWDSHYVDYATLKEQIRVFGKRRRKLQCGDLEWSTVLLHRNNNNSNNNNSNNNNTEVGSGSGSGSDNGGATAAAATCSPSLSEQQQEQKDTDGNNNDHATNLAAFGYTTLYDNDGTTHNDGLMTGCGGLGDAFFGGGSRSDISNAERLSKLEHDEFKFLLQQELTKASHWFQARWSSDLYHHPEQEEHHPPPDNNNRTSSDINSTITNDDVQEETTILELYGFLVVNICVLRQLLLRYNTHVRMYDDAFGSIFLSEWELFAIPEQQQQQQPSSASASASACGGGSGCFSVSSMITIDVNDGSKNNNNNNNNNNPLTTTPPPPPPSLIDFLEPLQDRMMTMSSYWIAADGSETSTTTTTNSNNNNNNNNNKKHANVLKLILNFLSSYWIAADDSDNNSSIDNNNNNNSKNNSSGATEFRKRANALELIFDQTSWKQQTKIMTQKNKNYTNKKQSLKMKISSLGSQRNALIQTVRSWYMMGSGQLGISMEPKFLTNVRGFKKEIQALAKWKEEGEGSTSSTATSQGVVATTGDMDPANVWPLLLNLVSCYLFMMNTYIIEPSSAYYANALGSSDAMSGVMMGMAPWCALVSAVGYSVWTNTSYKAPILFAGTLMMIGNTLYGVAYSYQSMPLCLVGRAISGFGAPRIINRRYVADATPFHLRTISSAAFALTTALGAASGPGIAILVDLIPPFTFTIPLIYYDSNGDDNDNENEGQQQQQSGELRFQTFNGMTGPGFVMAILWFLYSLLIIFTFREPNRSGLEELKQREKATAKKEEEEQQQTQQKDTGPSSEALCPTNNDNDDITDSYTDYYDDEYDDDDDLFSVGSNAFSASGSTEKKKTSSSSSSSSVSKHSPLYCITNMTRATALCMVLIFMKRIALESIVGSTSVITKNRYAWSIRNVGVLHLVNGLIVIPVSIFAGWLSQYREDRYLAMWFMGITAVGLVLMIDFTDLLVGTDATETYNEDMLFSVGPIQYIMGSIIAFSGVEACESFVASLMSKCVPSALAVGTFNSGLLATLVGTGGRAVGDVFITAMGLLSIRNLLNLLIIPGLVLILFSMLLLGRNYKIVAV